jgi:hypothetical protein
MDWYGKTHLNPAYTKKLMKKWQSPPGNTAAQYYILFPAIYPKHLPDDHYIVKYNEAKYPTHRDYSTFRSAPKELKSTHQVEWEDGYGPCNVCEECISVKQRNQELQEKYYKRLAAWRENGTPM